MSIPERPNAKERPPSSFIEQPPQMSGAGLDDRPRANDEIGDASRQVQNDEDTVLSAGHRRSVACGRECVPRRRRSVRETKSGDGLGKRIRVPRPRQDRFPSALAEEAVPRGRPPPSIILARPT